MGKRSENKTQFSARLFNELAMAVAKWLERNPECNRTNFLTKALTDKLERYGSKLGSKARKPSNGASRGARVLITAWLPRPVLLEMDYWRRRLRPQRTRTAFFNAAIAEALLAEKLITEDAALKYGAYLEYAQATAEIQELLKQSPLRHKIPPIAELSPTAAMALRDELLALVSEINAKFEHVPPLPQRAATERAEKQGKPGVLPKGRKTSES